MSEGYLPLHVAASAARDKYRRDGKGDARDRDDAAPLAVACVRWSSTLFSSWPVVRPCRSAWLRRRAYIRRTMPSSSASRFRPRRFSSRCGPKCSHRCTRLWIETYLHWTFSDRLLALRPRSVGERDKAGGRLPLHEAAPVGDFDLARRLVDEWPGSVRVRCSEGMLPLPVSARHGKLELSDYLVVRWSGSVQERSYAGRLPMHETARGGDLKTVKFIHSCWSESVRQQPDDGRVPLREAASSGDLDVAQFLVMEWPESVRETSNDGRRPLHVAASSGKQPVARCLLHKFPQSVHVKTVDGRLPLHEARRGHGDKWKNHQLALVRSLSHVDHSLLKSRILTALYLCTTPWPKARRPRWALSNSWLRNPPSRCNSRMLPVHIAAASGAPFDVPYYLTAKRPESIYGGNPRPRTAPGFPQPRKRPRPDSMS
jgi:hypothetical protein